MIKYLAIDYGSKKIGLAIGDNENKVASPFDILPNDHDFLKKLDQIIKEEEINSFVVGLPVYMDGGETHFTQEVRRFVQVLENFFKKEVITVDERLTSKISNDLIKGGEPKDDVAAMLILQGYLDNL